MNGMMGREERATKGQCGCSHTVFTMPVLQKSLRCTELFNNHKNHLNKVQNFSLRAVTLFQVTIHSLVIIVTLRLCWVGWQYSCRQTQYKSLQGISVQNAFLRRNSSAQIDNCLRAACHLPLPLCFFGCLICLLLLLSLHAEARGDKTKQQY